MRKRTVTTIEMQQIVTVRRPVGAALDWCPKCLKPVEMAPLEEAALLTGVSLRYICRRVGDGDTHFVETANGGLICLPSLLNKICLGDGGLNSDGADIQSSPDLSDAAKPPGCEADRETPRDDTRHQPLKEKVYEIRSNKLKTTRPNAFV